MRWLVPREYAPSVQAIDLAALRRRGIEALLLDLDNTLVPWGAREIPEALPGWIAAARAHGLRLCIVTNNFTRRAERIARALGVEAVTAAAKPASLGLRGAMRRLGTAPASTALVGDQLFTDILGGNLLGLYTVLVPPLSRREFPTTRLVRLAEALVMSLVRRRMPASSGTPGAPRRGSS
ncbi:MAG: YqeG family HAD IIIA-type phosphatase [Armatimonadetes bacterium]|nr:YqeG family HAD IIIA-type phosphatase [Armatimonadota bacterium]